MRFVVEIVVRRKAGVADPEGSTITEALERLGYQNIQNVRIARMFRITVNAENVDSAEEISRTIAKEVLANPVIEEFSIHKIEEITD